MPTLRMEVKRQRIWIPAFAGMTKSDPVIRVLSFFVIPAQAGIHRAAYPMASALAEPWIPAFAGMTKESAARRFASATA